MLWKYSMTQVVCKQLLPIYDKPILSTRHLMQANIRDVLIICTPHYLSLFQTLLGDGGHWWLKL
ncbi:sugar phosphate nucleotidyltransferase [Shewanella glacialipiscicola]|uniref:sugar phosphate nucleotidyltransferase n=1 Tax=Shewanella glacialipiscicola TaxID=614069 RepID=UPI003D7ADE07